MYRAGIMFCTSGLEIVLKFLLKIMSTMSPFLSGVCVPHILVLKLNSS